MPTPSHPPQCGVTGIILWSRDDELQREARWRQHRWTVDVMSVTSLGSHDGRRTDPDLPPEQVANGTKLLDQDADAGTNFLPTSILEVAQARVSADNKQIHQTLDGNRLFRDLLSSMPDGIQPVRRSISPTEHRVPGTTGRDVRRISRATIGPRL